MQVIDNQTSVPAANRPSEPEQTPQPNYIEDPRTGDFVPYDKWVKRRERTRARNTLNQRRCRAKKRAAVQAEIAALAIGVTVSAPYRLTAEQQRLEALALATWLKIDGARQRQHRRHRHRLLAARIIVLGMREELWLEPEPREFASTLSAALKQPIDRHTARNVLTALHKLEGADGPWPGSSAVTPDA